VPRDAHALALGRAHGCGQRGLEGGGEIADIETLTLMRQIGECVDIDLAADVLRRDSGSTKTSKKR